MNETQPRRRREYPDGYWCINQVLAREAEAAGEPLDPVCPVCSGLGWVKHDLMPGDPEFGQLVQCEQCSTPARKRWLVHNCGLEGAALDLRLATDWLSPGWSGVTAQERARRTEQRQLAYRVIKTAIEERKGLHTFWGDFGSGKSHALTLVCNELRDRMVETYYTPLAGILDHLRSMYGAKLETSDFWQRLLDIPVLALDEISRFNPTPWAQEKLFVLIDTRYRRRGSHLTLFATNEDPRISLPPTESLGYVHSRCREGTLVELSGDLRGSDNGPKKFPEDY